MRLGHPSNEHAAVFVMNLALADVRFAPQSDQLLRRRNMT
jgi:hypothetical protein